MKIAIIGLIMALAAPVSAGTIFNPQTGQHLTFRNGPQFQTMRPPAPVYSNPAGSFLNGYEQGQRIRQRREAIRLQREQIKLLREMQRELKE